MLVLYHSVCVYIPVPFPNLQCMLRAENGRHWCHELHRCRESCDRTFGTDPVENVFELELFRAHTPRADLQQILAL